ncbi:hypothetical protein FS837_010460 [Tulasnella sp. UAMH 9824]|nr:hypothetical protein FS837_010460 [Tulasnella sp. UAMH 9824]
MFAKFKSTRTPAATAALAPQFELGPNTLSVPKQSPSLVKKIFNVKKVFRRSSSAQKDATSQGSSNRQHGVSAPSQPSRGPFALTYDDRAELDGRPYLRSPAQPTRSPTSLNSSPRPQPGWQSSTSTSHRSNFSVTASPLLAPPQFAATSPAPNFASTRSPSYRSTQPAAHHSTSSLDASSLLTPPPSISTTPGATFVRPPSSSKCSAPSDTLRSTSHRQHGVSAHSPSSEGLPLTYDDRAGLDGRPHLRSPAQPTRSPTSLNSSPHPQPGWQNSTSTSHRSNFSATSSPLLALPEFTATTPAPNFASTRSSSYRSTHSAALHSTSSLDTSSLLTPPPSISTTPAATVVRPRSSSKHSTPSATPRSTYSPKVSSPLAAPKSVVTVPPTTFYPARSPPSITPRATRPLHTSALLVPPQPITTTPATEHSIASSRRGSNPISGLSPSQQLIADLEETAAYLQRQYDASERGVHSMIQCHVFPYTMSLADDAKKAKTELDEVMEKIAAVDRECAELEALFRDECNKFPEAEEALKKAQSILEETDMEQAELQATVHELQAGQPVNGVWVERDSEPLDSTSSQCVEEPAEGDRGTSSTTHDWSQGAKKVVKSWDSRWNSQIALQRYSIPRAAQTTAKSAEEGHRSETNQGQGAKSAAPNLSLWMQHGPGPLGGADTNGPSTSTLQAPVSTPNGPEQQTQAPFGRNADLVDTSDCFGQPLRWGQLASDSAVPPGKRTIHPSKHT